MKKAGWLFAAIAALAFSGWFAYQPYHAMQELQKAARAGDAAALNQYVDFPALRENVRAQLAEKMSARMDAHKDNPFAGIGSAFAKAMVGPIVDAVLTPDAIALIASGIRPALRPKPLPSGPGDVPAHPPAAENRADRMHAAYTGFNRFEASAVKDEPGAKPLKLIFLRDGLNWKLSAIDLAL